MSTRYPLEALLRPPVELWSALVAACAALAAAAAPAALLMTPATGAGAAGLFALLALARATQAVRVLRYLRSLRRLPEYRLRAARIPVSRHRLFLGLGFRWTALHTQRLRDAERPEARRYTEPGWLYRLARRQEIAWESRPGLRSLARLLSRRAWWNPLRPLAPLGGNPRLHGVEPREQAVWMDLGGRVGHTLIIGTTRVGKTRLAELLIAQDIRRGDVVIVLDPKGDAELLKRVYAEARRAGRADRFYLFHLGFPELSARYNAVGHFARITEVATRITNSLPSEGNSAAFREFAWRFTNIIARALVALGRRPDYRAIARHIMNMDELFVEYCRHWLAQAAPGWEAELATRMGRIRERELPSALRGRSREVVALVELLRARALYDPVAEGLLSAVQYDRTYFDKIVASVLPLLEKLTTGRTAELIAPDYFDLHDPRPIFDWMEVIRRGGIVYVGLDALSDQTVASAVGNSMFADLTSVAGKIYKHGITHGLPELPGEAQAPCPVLSIHADEFNELIGEEFVPLLNKAGGAGYQVTAYTQTWSDVEARIGSRAKAGQVAGNFNTLIMLRVRELATAEMLTRQLKEVPLYSLSPSSGVSDSSEPLSPVDFVARNEDRLTLAEAPLLTPGDLMELPKGQAFALLEGGQLWKIRIPLPEARGDPCMPESLAVIADQMGRAAERAELTFPPERSDGRG